MVLFVFSIFTSHEKDDAGVVRVARLPQMMQQLGAAAKSEQLQTILKRLDRPSFETGLVDFATFVLILERWHDEFDVNRLVCCVLSVCDCGCVSV